jgi:hypothetical protein
MGFIGLFYPWGLIIQALALVHFVRRRPEAFWLWVILLGGGPGALIYLLIEVVPDADFFRGALHQFSRRRRIRTLEAIVVENPAVGNKEELADLYLEERKFARARELYGAVLAAPTPSIDPYYRRAIAALEMGDAKAALADLEVVIAKDPKYDFQRAIGLLAHAHALAGDPSEADRLFTRATEVSTLTETSVNYATFLAAQGRAADARQWAERVLATKATMPAYLRRRERPLFRKATALLKRLR